MNAMDEVFLTESLAILFKVSLKTQVRKRQSLLALASSAQKLINANQINSALVTLEELKAQIKLNVSTRSSALGMVQSTINSVKPQ